MNPLYSIRKTIAQLRHRPFPMRVERLLKEPDAVQTNTFYLIGHKQHPWAAMLTCPCGCSARIELNLLSEARPCWTPRTHMDGTVSLVPSIGPSAAAVTSGSDAVSSTGCRRVDHSYLAKAARRSRARMAPAHRRVSSRPFSEQLRLDDLARTAGVHPSHLNRVFRARYGCSIGEYARRLGVSEQVVSWPALKTPIVEIAASAGFADQSHFSRVFARITGFSPGWYRKLHQ